MKTFFIHQTKREELIKFLLLLCVLVAYFAYLSWQYDLATGGIVSVLTWSFFVLCTPVADAGFLIDFPVRVITGLRMFITEMIVWVLAITINVVSINFFPKSYDVTFITSLFHKILTTPWPYWSIIALCASGTFLSIRFGDEMLDVVSHRDRDYHHTHAFKLRIIGMVFVFVLIVVAYYFLLEKLNVQIPGE